MCLVTAPQFTHLARTPAPTTNHYSPTCLDSQSHSRTWRGAVSGALDVECALAQLGRRLVDRQETTYMQTTVVRRDETSETESESELRPTPND